MPTQRQKRRAWCIHQSINARRLGEYSGNMAQSIAAARPNRQKTKPHHKNAPMNSWRNPSSCCMDGTLLSDMGIDNRGCRYQP